jgi:transcriptional regulator GlxA family with amidase domain
MLLDAHIEENADILSVEQSVLALLSWAFAKGSNPLDDRAPKTSLHPQAALKARQVAELLRQRIDAPPTIAQLSALVGMNESDLKRCFKCLYGNSIAAYSRRRRLDTACDLLTHSPLSVAAIALEVGFTNPSQFARAFRRQFGLNPSDYRSSAK